MSVKKSLIWTSLGQIVLFSSQLASQIIVARHLSPYLVGISAVAFSITDFINLMQTFGLRNFIIREADLPGHRLRTTFTINLILSLLTCGLVLSIAYWGAAAYHEPAVGQVLRVTALIPLVMSFELVPGALLQRNMQFGALAVANGAKAAVTAGVTIAMVFLDAGYMSIGYGALTGAIVSALLTNAFGWRSMHWGFSLRDWRRISRFGVDMFGIAGISTVSIRATELILGKMLGLVDLAIYSRASALNNLLWTNIHSVFTRVVFSSMAEARRTTGSIKAVYLKTMDMVTSLLWPAFAGLAVFAGPVVHLLYGPKWVAAAPVLSIFALAAIGLTSITMTWEVFVVCEQTRTQTKLETIRSIITFLITVLGATQGLVPAALGRVGDALVSNLIYRKPLVRYTDTCFAEVFAIYRRNGLLTLVAIAPPMSLMALNHWSPATDIRWVFAAMAAGIAFWTLAVQLFHPDLYSEIRGMVSAMARKKAGRRGPAAT